MKDMRPYQQGDVLIKPVEQIPNESNLKAVNPVNGNLILAEGEVTGHFHGIPSDGNVALLENPETEEVYLKIAEKPATVTHQEHHAITMEPGIYKIDIVQEYDHFAEKAERVAD